MDEADVSAGSTAPDKGRLPWWQRRLGVALIAFVCLVVGIGIGGASSSSSHKPTAAQLAAEAQASKARIHREEVEKVAAEHNRVADERKEAHQKAVEAREAAHREHEEAAKRTQEVREQKEQAARKLEEQTKVFNGSATENLGTVNIETESTLTWNCEGCTESNFIINSSSGPTNVLVNALNETSGHTIIDEGSYKDFDVEGNGSWTVRISPNG